MKIPALPSILRAAPFLFVDAGAAGGFQDRWTVLRPHLKVIGFEPDRRSFDALASTDEVVYINAGVGKAPETRTLFLTRKPTCTATFPPNSEWLARFPDAERYEEVARAEISVTAMDDALEQAFGRLPAVDFVKLDIHGCEPDVLAGARRIIAAGVIGFEIELCFASLWRGQGLFHDTAARMAELGFELFDVRPYYWKREASVAAQIRGQMVFGDALFFRAPEDVCALVRAMADREDARAKAAHALSAYLVYGYRDLAAALLRLVEDLFSAEERAAIDAAIRPGLGERAAGFLLRRAKLHRLAHWLATITDPHGRTFVQCGTRLGNYDDLR